ncbi:MAG: hypothetical protein RhofKO_08620 [Rhodothermales bacterium]
MYTGNAGQAAHRQGLVAIAAVGQEAFARLLMQMEQPLVLMQGKRDGKRRYYVQYGGYVFMHKTKTAYDPSTHANIIEVERLYSSFDWTGW